MVSLFRAAKVPKTLSNGVHYVVTFGLQILLAIPQASKLEEYYLSDTSYSDSSISPFHQCDNPHASSRLDDV